MKTLTLLLLLFPCIVSAQATTEDYAIYSQYLKTIQDSCKTGKVCFVANETTAYSQKFNLAGIDNIVRELRAYLKGDKNNMSYIYLTFKDFSRTMITDTLWVALLADLDKRMGQGFKIENHFSPDLQTAIIDTTIYNKYFSHFSAAGRIERNWIRFHKKYGTLSLLIELSPIVSDGQRAVFYFSKRCGGLCGEGDLLFFGKENNEWALLQRASLWYN